jgi:hypothetical protein
MGLGCSPEHEHQFASLLVFVETVPSKKASYLFAGRCGLLAGWCIDRKHMVFDSVLAFDADQVQVYRRCTVTIAL